MAKVIQDYTMYVVLVLFGLLGNVFHIPLLFGIDFVFGSIAVMIILNRYRLRDGIIAALIIHSPTILLWGHYYALIIFILEAIWVGSLLQSTKPERRNLVWYDTLFWVFVGMPLIWLCYGLIMKMDYQAVHLVAFKQSVNGMFNALWASMIIAYTPYGKRYFRIYSSDTILFQQALYHALAGLVLTVSIGLITFQTLYSTYDLKNQILTRLHNTADRNVFSMVNQWFDNELYALEALAHQVEILGFERYDTLQTMTKMTYKSSPNLLHVYVADDTATVINTAPFLNDQGHSWRGINFHEQPYFAQLRTTMQPVVSDVFMGRIGTPKPVLTISIPVVKNQALYGYVQGELNLERLQQHLLHKSKDTDLVLTLLDRQGKVIASSDTTQQPSQVLSRHQSGIQQTIDKNTVFWMPETKNQSPLTQWKQGVYVYRIPLMNHSLGWELIVELPLAPYHENLYELYIQNLAIMLAILLATILFSRYLSQKIVRSLERLSVITTQLSNQSIQLKNIDWPHSRISEINLLIDGFNTMAHSLQDKMQKLEEANTAKSQFVANMSHELRTPMNAIIGYSEMMQEDMEDNEALADYESDIKKIHSSGKHLLNLINEILDISKIEAGKMELYQETFNLNTLVNEVVVTVEPLVQNKNNHLEVNLDQRINSIHTDLTKLRQMLFNLLSNASKFTEQGTIRLSTTMEIDEQERSWVKICVADQGIGMTDEQINKLFDPFTQADKSTTRKYGGTGLGLTITKRFAEMMNGTIQVQSKYGQGSEFTIRIPTNIGTPILGDLSQIPKAGENNQILVIDDDPLTCELLSEHLRTLGYEVHVAHSGEQGLKLAKQVQPYAITLDIQMPDIDGWTVLTTLKTDEELNHIPVIITSMVENRRFGYALGAADYLVKPVEKNQLDHILSRYQSHSESKDGFHIPQILVVDDDTVTKEALVGALEYSGWHVLEASNGTQALDILEHNTPDLILSDLLMPEMDGFEFIGHLRTNPKWWSIPVVVLTAKDINQSELTMLNQSVENVFMKETYHQSDLLAEIERQLQHHEPN
ncbi:response regulator [Candidatus Albibeggiatoa sp. nov. NOAA]|uniref:response regulator n=1 Tax=Candidatus Albibeggiatoa sp. nov. NOAA TaxID=3162724 RepID=UPI0032F8D110|nr:response regulator [Thiotrichaceae bacterium]